MEIPTFQLSGYEGEIVGLLGKNSGKTGMQNYSGWFCMVLNIRSVFPPKMSEFRPVVYRGKYLDDKGHFGSYLGLKQSISCLK